VGMVMDIIQLFPKCVGKFELDRELTKKEKKVLINASQRPNEGNTSSLDNYILENKELKKLKSFIQECLDNYFLTTFCPKENTVSLRITQSWTNNSKHTQYHHKHQHPNSLLSGVFYIQSSENDKITFHDEPYEQLRIPPATFNVYNSPSWWLPATQGLLYIFKSSLTHSVPHVIDNQTRISLAFNTFPVGSLGDDYELTGLKLKG
jgi:uncharacterized protein (TIGR02466 family)